MYLLRVKVSETHPHKVSHKEEELSKNSVRVLSNRRVQWWTAKDARRVLRLGLAKLVRQRNPFTIKLLPFTIATPRTVEGQSIGPGCLKLEGARRYNGGLSDHRLKPKLSKVYVDNRRSKRRWEKEQTRRRDEEVEIQAKPVPVREV